jgi:hypothetical protein
MICIGRKSIQTRAWRQIESGSRGGYPSSVKKILRKWAPLSHFLNGFSGPLRNFVIDRLILPATRLMSFVSNSALARSLS